MPSTLKVVASILNYFSIWINIYRLNGPTIAWFERLAHNYVVLTNYDVTRFNHGTLQTDLDNQRIIKLKLRLSTNRLLFFAISLGC